MSRLKSAPQRPVASVVIPVYNTETYLAKAIDSVLGQTFTDFEVVLLDDGSTDGSAEILDRYQAMDSRCKVFHGPNRGIIATRNEGNRLAEADIIILMDSDDICLPERFAKQVRYLHDNPACVAVGSKMLLIDDEDLPITEMGDKFSHDEIDSANLSGVGSHIFQPTVALRKDAVQKVGGYRAEFPHAEDFDLFLRLAEIGRLANYPEVFLKYRQHLSSIGYRHREKQVDSTMRAVKDAYQRRGRDYQEFETSKPDIASQNVTDAYRKWAWWALKAGHLRTAQKYSLKALKSQPFNPETWKLCACVLRGR